MHKPMRPIRISARDRRNAAMHEAGHIVVARLFSIEVAHAYIYISDEVSDILCDKTWLGHTVFNARDLRSANRRQRAMFGVAGAVADRG
jgi:hypothetical protein